MSDIVRRHRITDQKYADYEQLDITFTPGKADNEKLSLAKMEYFITDIHDFIKTN